MVVRTAAGQVVGSDRPRCGLRPRDWLLAVALGVVSGILRGGPLGPSSLWLDDAWTALVVRADSWPEAAGLAVTAPGFALLLRGWLAAVGFSETAAQLPAFAFAVLGPPAVYIAAVRARLHPVAGVLGGVLLAVAPAHLTVATRVKQYTLDALLATALIALAWRVLAAPADGRRWSWLLAGSTVATALSAAVAPVVAAAFLAGLAAAWRDRTGLRPGLYATGAYAVVGTAWYLAFLRPSVSPALRDYWVGSYIDLSAGPVSASRDLVRGLGGVLAALSALPAVPVGLALLAALVVVGARRPALALLLAGPVAVAGVLAALRLAPLGGGRTDVYLLPGLVLLAAVAVDRACTADPRMGAGLAAGAVTASLLAWPGPAPYPHHDVRPLVAELEAELGAGDAVLVYSATRWAYALYTGFGVAFPDDPTQPTGFDVVVRDPRVHVLEPQRDHPERYAPDVAAGIEGADRVWLLASAWQDDLAVLERLLTEAGLREVTRHVRPGGLLVEWAR